MTLTKRRLRFEEAKADGDSVIDGVELGEALGGESFEEERQAGLREWGVVVWRGGWKRRVDSLGEDFGELRGRNGTAVEPSLADVAAEPEEHVGDGLGCRLLRRRWVRLRLLPRPSDGGGDLSALAVVSDGADEAGVDFELVEREKLEMAKAGVAGSEVIER